MTRTTFIDGTTVVNSLWLNEVDNQTQNTVGGLSNTIERTPQEKFIEFVSVKDFGAVGDGTTDDSSAITVAMLSGYRLYFPQGVYHITSNLVINMAVEFAVGASLLIDSTKTVTFENYITAGRYQLFTGPGSVLFNSPQSFVALPEWFGAFPEQPLVDTGPLLQKLSNSIVSGRECLILFGVGTWYIQTPVSWSRACRVLGAGERLTHFRCGPSFGTGDVFDTQEQGVTFENLQFSSVVVRTSGAYIRLKHNYCRAINIWFTDGFGGVLVDSSACDVRHITGFTWSSAAGSYIVNLADTYSATDVDDITYIDMGSNSPAYVLKIDDHDMSNIGRVFGRGAETVVGIVPSSGTSRGISVDQVIAQDCVNGVLIQSSGSGGVENLHVGKVITDTCTYGIRVQKDGSGVMKFMEFEALTDRASSTCGFKVDASSGSVDHWHLKGGFVRNGLGNGYAIANSDYWTITGVEAVSNAGTGSLIALGCGGFIYTNNRNLFNTTANLTDSSGAVTKVITNNI